MTAPAIAAAANSMARNNRRAAEKNRGEEAVFLPAQSIPQHADEPQEGHPGERDQI